ncbi:hypothetical protein RclHR1_00130003 [Rhizophagus clarus]|uniref:Uncharacterized protein n=1 Tax=Rhizophagus clarus TaxID=94130 RepID=A0A2Z6QDG6_9GLOM|nr:hypothetical protein RclHR1_00130003 [Rhizophagus clarus]
MTLRTYKQLLSHERGKHRNNKTIPHRHLLSQPSVEQLISYQNAFIILIKKRLGFNRHSVGSKRLSINVFPEKIFVYLFQNEPLFWYNSALRKYHCKFKGEAGELRLKQILNYEHWNCRQDPKTNTTGYVLFANYEGIYEVTFSWAQTENGIMSNQEYQSEGRSLTHNKNSHITFNTNNN